MIGAFTYKGVSSSTFNLVCKSVKRPLLAALKSNVIKIPGSSNVYDPGGSNYDLMNLTMKIQYLGTNFYELRTRAQAIANWLRGGTWGKLFITGEPGYYVCKIEEEIDLDTIVDQTPSGEADITFVCLPFLYGPGQEYNGSSWIPFNPA